MTTRTCSLFSERFDNWMRSGTLHEAKFGKMSQILEGS